MKEKKIRKIKVYGQSGYNYQEVPTIILKGKWLDELDFRIGNPIEVYVDKGIITIKKM